MTKIGPRRTSEEGRKLEVIVTIMRRLKRELMVKFSWPLIKPKVGVEQLL